MKSKILIIAALLCGAAAYGQSGDPLPFFRPSNPYVTGTTPTNGTNAVETLSLSTLATSGTYLVSFAGSSKKVAISGTETDAVAATEFLTAIASIPTINGTANFGLGVSGTTPATVTGTFTGNLGVLNVAQWVPSVLSGAATLTGTTTTPGVTADGRSAPPASLLIDKGDRTLYQNTGTVSQAPNWTRIYH